MEALKWERLKAIIERHRIVYGVIAALLIASLLTLVSMALYVSSGASRLDLSRPGYERVRSGLQSDNDDSTFSSSGPVNQAVLDDFQSRFSKHRNVLDKLDTFDTDALGDTQLQIPADTNQ